MAQVLLFGLLLGPLFFHTCRASIAASNNKRDMRHPMNTRIDDSGETFQSSLLADIDAKTRPVVIDVDSHFEPGAEWLEPYPELAAKLPKLDPGLLAVNTIVGDLLRDVPVAQQPPLAELLPPGLLQLFGQE